MCQNAQGALRLECGLPCFFLVRPSGCVFDTLNDLYRLDIDHESRALVLGEGNALSRGSEDLHY